MSSPLLTLGEVCEKVAAPLIFVLDHNGRRLVCRCVEFTQTPSGGEYSFHIVCDLEGADDLASDSIYAAPTAVVQSRLVSLPEKANIKSVLKATTPFGRLLIEYLSDPLMRSYVAWECGGIAVSHPQTLAEIVYSTRGIDFFAHLAHYGFSLVYHPNCVLYVHAHIKSPDGLVCLQFARSSSARPPHPHSAHGRGVMLAAAGASSPSPALGHAKHPHLVLSDAARDHTADRRLRTLRKNLQRVRALPACPPCTCGMVAEVQAENARRARELVPRKCVAGKSAACKASCSQRQWMIANGYCNFRKADRLFAAHAVNNAPPAIQHQPRSRASRPPPHHPHPQQHRAAVNGPTPAVAWSAGYHRPPSSHSPPPPSLPNYARPGGVPVSPGSAIPIVSGPPGSMPPMRYFHHPLAV